MNSGKRVKGFFVLLLFIISGFVIAVPVFAQTDTSQVTYTYVDLKTLDDGQKDQILKKNPSEVLTHDFENYILVYQKIDKSQLPPKSNATNILPTSMKSSNVTSKTLPKTGENMLNGWSGFVVLIGVVGLFIWRRKQLKQLLLVMIILGGIGTISQSLVYAQGNSYLLPQKQINVKKATVPEDKPESISGYQFIGYIHSSEDKANPVVTKEGVVTVHYQDVNGKKLADDQLLNGKIGEKYQVGKRDLVGYSFIEIKGAANGTFKEVKQEVTLVYQETIVKTNGTVTIMYQDQEGNSISEQSVLSDKIGASKEIIPKEIAGYTLVENQPNKKVTFSTTPQSLIFVYRKAEDAVSTITIRYLDQNDVEISESQEVPGTRGNTYLGTPKVITGYILDDTRNSKNPVVYTGVNQVLNIYYLKVMPIVKVEITVRYIVYKPNGIDIERELRKDVIIKTAGETFTTTKLEFPNYQFEKVVGNASGVSYGADEVVLYVYRYVEQANEVLFDKVMSPGVSD